MRVAMCLVWCGRNQRGLELLELGLADARQRGSRPASDWYVTLRAYARLRSGQIREAEADARHALDLHDVHGWAGGLPNKLGVIVSVLCELGDLEHAQRTLAEHGHDSGPPQRDAFGLYLLESRGHLRLAEGHAERGLSDFLLCAEWLSQMGFRDAAMFPWRRGAALAQHALGAETEARALATEQLELARAFGAPAALGEALRVQAAVEPDADARMDHLRNALRVLEGANAPLEQAKALVDLGATLRRSRRRSEARPHLEQGMELAHRCRATVLAEHAREELIVLGARPRRFVATGVDSLTASERRVAEMAASGMTNREIAQALFVTQKTVEFHLSHTYQKLDIDSRRELSRALSGEMAAPE
jgi:ATP/maltotriose-dependent transcriptional regulator MalT